MPQITVSQNQNSQLNISFINDAVVNVYRCYTASTGLDFPYLCQNPTSALNTLQSVCQQNQLPQFVERFASWAGCDFYDYMGWRFTLAEHSQWLSHVYPRPANEPNGTPQVVEDARRLWDSYWSSLAEFNAAIVQIGDIRNGMIHNPTRLGLAIGAFNSTFRHVRGLSFPFGELRATPAFQDCNSYSEQIYNLLRDNNVPIPAPHQFNATAQPPAGQQPGAGQQPAGIAPLRIVPPINS